MLLGARDTYLELSSSAVIGDKGVNNLTGGKFGEGNA